MTRLSDVLQHLERAGAGPYASRAVPQLLAVRRCVSRIDVIVRTGFLPPAYALLEVLIVMIISLMMIARFKSIVAEMLLVPFVALVNIYMLRLIKDVDNPFDFQDGVRDHDLRRGHAVPAGRVPRAAGDAGADGLMASAALRPRCAAGRCTRPASRQVLFCILYN